MMSDERKFKDRLIQLIAPPLARVIIRFLSLTMRIETLHEERVRPFWEEDKRMILTFWHGRLLMIPVCYHGKGIKILISQHQDGELIARTMKLFGYGTIRGSSTRGGASAMRKMLKACREWDIAITPDGPRGPRHEVREGTIILAKLAGVPIVPVTFGSSRKKVFSSWDRFNLPCPFSRGAFLWGEPLHVERDADVEEKRQELERQMRKMTDSVDKYVSM